MTPCSPITAVYQTGTSVRVNSSVQEITGVEIYAELCKITSENIKRYYQQVGKRPPDWSIVNANVRHFLPDKRHHLLHV